LYCLVIAGDESEEEEADDPDTPGKGKKSKRGAETAGRSSGKSKGKSLTASAKAALAASKKPPVSKFAALRHSAYKALFGWLDPKFKRNGKKLLSSNSVLWKFMVSFAQWGVRVLLAVDGAMLELCTMHDGKKVHVSSCIQTVIRHWVMLTSAHMRLC
jgi:hypothetical protein